jgi:hypothetical protein
MDKTFTFRLVATTGCEILQDNNVVAWTIDEIWAARIVAALSNEEQVE